MNNHFVILHSLLFVIVRACVSTCSCGGEGSIVQVEGAKMETQGEGWKGRRR